MSAEADESEYGLCCAYTVLHDQLINAIRPFFTGGDVGRGALVNVAVYGEEPTK
jgi:hypothetical protein